MVTSLTFGPMNAKRVHLRGRDRSDAVKFADPEVRDERGSHLWRDDEQPVGLAMS
jgi:hypothetical protein